MAYEQMETARGLEALIATFEDLPHRTYGMRLAAETIVALETYAVQMDENGAADAAESSFMMERLTLAARKCIPDHELRRACYAGNTMAVRALLADPRVMNFNDALSSACEKNRVEIVRLLLADPRIDPSPKPNGTQHDLLVNLISQGSLEIARLIIAHPRSRPAGLALHAACSIEDTTLVRELVNHPRLTPRHGQTRAECIHLAHTHQLISGRKDITKILNSREN